MSRAPSPKQLWRVGDKYKFHDPEGLYFISFATVDWIDVLTRADYLAPP